MPPRGPFCRPDSPSRSTAQSPVGPGSWAPAHRAGSFSIQHHPALASGSVRKDQHRSRPPGRGFLHSVPPALAGRRNCPSESLKGRHRRSPLALRPVARSSRRGQPRPFPRDTSGDTPGDTPHGEAVVFIVHDLVSPCQLDRARFTPVRTPQASRVTGFAHPVCPVHGISREDSSGWSVTPPSVPDASTERGTPVLLAAPAAAVLRGCVPCGGTRSEVVARRAGGIGALAGSWPLSTGGPREAAGMISFSFVRVGR